MKGYHLSSWLGGLGKSRGQVAIMVALSSFVLAGFSALSIDMGYYMLIRQRLQNTLDAAALAGAHGLPRNQAEAERLARDFAEKNGLSPEEIERISFGCRVDRNEQSLGPEVNDIRAICSQLLLNVGGFTCNEASCYSPCTFPTGGASGGCNTISVTAERQVQTFLAPVLGANLDVLTARLDSTACRGGCGTPPDLDVVLIIDRTTSLTTPQFNNIQDGARSVLNSNFDPDLHRFSIAVMQEEPARLGTFLLFDNMLRSDDPRLIGAIDNLQRAGSQTNLATPMNEAINMLTIRDPNPDAIKQIVLLTDGVPDHPSTSAPCRDAYNAATEAHRQDIRVFTIGYFAQEDEGLGGGRCTSDNEPPNWDGVEAHQLLFSMAAATEDPTGNGFPRCRTVENGDDDDFFCVFANDSNSAVDLANIFNRIIQEILDEVGSGSSLVDLSTFNIPSYVGN